MISIYWGETEMTRKEVLEQAEKCVNGSREEDYGSPEHNFDRIAKMWNAYLGDNIVDAHDVAMMLSLLKIARARSGRKMDNYIDLAGYAACAGEIVAHKQNPCMLGA